MKLKDPSAAELISRLASQEGVQVSEKDEPRVVGPGFNERVAEVVREVPEGRVVTYGDVAGALGSRSVARHVGWALSRLGDAVPWHRVVNGRGQISYRGDDARGEVQRRRLEAEGITFDPEGRLDLKSLRWPLLLRSLFGVIASLLPMSAHAQVDPQKARKKYAECRALYDSSKPCKAQTVCEEGLQALATEQLQALHDKARDACQQRKDANKLRRKLASPCKTLGHERTLRSNGECCWPEQQWVGGQCTGVPARCPDGHEVSGVQCQLIQCAEGKKHVDGLHCCWPEQLWSIDSNRCLGVPSCPAGLEAKGEECFTIIPDFDKDGVPDHLDACKEAQEDPDGHEDEDGCPDPDDDGDGVCDPIIATWGKNDGTFGCYGADTCPMVSEDLDGFEDGDGCPDPDNDGDGLLDVDDECPDLSGEVEQNGCPLPPDYTLQILSWTGVGTGAILLGTGIGLHVWASDLRDQITQTSSSDGFIDNVTEVEAREINETSSTINALAITSLCVGSGALITGAVLLILDAQEDAEETPGVSWSISPLGGALRVTF